MRNLFLFGALFLSVNASAETVPAQQAKANGFTTCQNTVEGISKFVVNENNHASLATWNKSGSDNRLFNALISVKYSDGHSAAVVNVSHGKTGKCDGSYTTVFYIDKSCSAARETIFKDWKYTGELAGLVVLENQTGTVNKMLLPGGNGCVAITTEVGYQ
ncbi:hypothetical protein [Vibrio sp.]|uniref:hypothetical protein n=1 Tax=Vibrio sp. TaxID=678 RepID=UPI003AA9B86E